MLTYQSVYVGPCGTYTCSYRQDLFSKWSAIQKEWPSSSLVECHVLFEWPLIDAEIVKRNQAIFDSRDFQLFL